MKRLTKCVGNVNGENVYVAIHDMRVLGEKDKIIKVLGAYEDAEENGLLVKKQNVDKEIRNAVKVLENRAYDIYENDAGSYYQGFEACLNLLKETLGLDKKEEQEGICGRMVQRMAEKQEEKQLINKKTIGYCMCHTIPRH